VSHPGDPIRRSGVHFGDGPSDRCPLVWDTPSSCYAGQLTGAERVGSGGPLLPTRRPPRLLDPLFQLWLLRLL
jgi:hypothetical protein